MCMIIIAVVVMFKQNMAFVCFFGRKRAVSQS